MNSKRLVEIERRIKKIKLQLQDINVIRPGSLTRQYKKPKEQAGAYYQLSYMRQMKSRTDYVRICCVSEIERQIRDYKRWKKLIDQWVELGIEYSKLAMKLKVQQMSLISSSKSKQDKKRI